MKPGDFYLGVSEFFAVIIPGFVVVVTGVALIAPNYIPSDPAALDWSILAVASYILGQILFAVGAKWDKLYQHVRPTGDRPQFDKVGAIRKLTADRDCDNINNYQWSRSVLSKEHPDGFMEVLRKEADSKLFRSLIVPLAVLSAFCLWRGWTIEGAGTLVLMLLAFWRYRGQRAKASEAAYTHVITLFALEKILHSPPPEEQPVAPAPAKNRQEKSDRAAG